MFSNNFNKQNLFKIIKYKENYQYIDFYNILVSELIKKGVLIKEKNKDSIKFIAGFSSIGRSNPYSNLLVYIKKGIIFIKEDDNKIELNFSLDFIDLVTSSGFMFVFINIFFLIIKKFNIFLFFLSLIFFSFTAVIGYFITIIRFRRFLKKL